MRKRQGAPYSFYNLYLKQTDSLTMDSVQCNSNADDVGQPPSEAKTLPSEKQKETDQPEDECFVPSQPITSSPGTSSNGHNHRHDARARSSTDVRILQQVQRSPPLEDLPELPASQKRKVDHSAIRVRSKSHSISSTSSEALIGDTFAEDDNRTREREMWAMLAGQTAFKFQSYIFQRVLPKTLIKPHIFPRHVEDMETLIEKYSSSGKSERLEGAAEKWAELKSQWKWRKAHGLVLGTAKSAYLHISNPLEVMMKLDREKGDSLEDARRAFRNVLPPKLQEPGQEVVDIMHCIGLLTDKSSPPSPR